MRLEDVAFGYLSIVRFAGFVVRQTVECRGLCTSGYGRYHVDVLHDADLIELPHDGSRQGGRATAAAGDRECDEIAVARDPGASVAAQSQGRAAGCEISPAGCRDRGTYPSEIIAPGNVQTRVVGSDRPCRFRTYRSVGILVDGNYRAALDGERHRSRQHEKQQRNTHRIYPVERNPLNRGSAAAPVLAPGHRDEDTLKPSVRHRPAIGAIPNRSAAVPLCTAPIRS